MKTEDPCLVQELFEARFRTRRMHISGLLQLRSGLLLGPSLLRHLQRLQHLYRNLFFHISVFLLFPLAMPRVGKLPTKRNTNNTNYNESENRPLLSICKSFLSLELSVKFLESCRQSGNCSTNGHKRVCHDRGKYFSPLAFPADATLHPRCQTRIPAGLVTCEHICDSTSPPFLLPV
jgi:hypothetical protein